MQTEPQTKPPSLSKPVRITEQVWPEGTVPVVSVFNWAYNHVGFIRESIESILMQETMFPVEIIIHDDASTDGTTEIIREYEAKYPQLFRNIIQTENQWSQSKSVMTPMFTAPQGEFIALTHGDDYWTSPHKLQKQFEALDANPEVTLCYHRHEIRSGSEASSSVVLSLEGDLSHVGQLLGMGGIQTSTMVLRKSAILPMPDWLPEMRYGDIPLQLILAQAGDFIFLKDVWSVYRKHGAGVSAADNRRERVEAIDEIARHFDAHSSGKYRRELAAGLFFLHLWGANGALESSDLQAFRWHQRRGADATAMNSDLVDQMDEFERSYIRHRMRSLPYLVPSLGRMQVAASIWSVAFRAQARTKVFAIKSALVATGKILAGTRCCRQVLEN